MTKIIPIKDLTGWLNLQEPSTINDNQFVTLKNMGYDADKRLKTRYGTKTFWNPISPNKPVTSGFFHDDKKNSIRTLIVASGSDLWLYDENTGDWNSIATNLTEFEYDGVTRTRWSFDVLLNIIYMCNGVDNYCKYDPKTATFTRIGDTSVWVCTFDNSTDKITLTAHGLVDGDSVRFNSGTLPTELDRRCYYVVNKTTNDFQVSYTPNGEAIDFTDNGSGTITTYKSSQPRCRYIEYLADALYAAGEDINPSTLYVTNALGATAANWDSLTANQIAIGGSQDWPITWIEELQSTVLVYKSKSIYQVAWDLTSAQPIDTENGWYGNRAIKRVGNSLIHFNDRWFTTLRTKQAASWVNALQDSPLSDDVRALTSLVSPRQYDKTIWQYILPYTNYYGSFDTSWDDKLDTTLVYSSLVSSWSKYIYPAHYDMFEYRDSDGVYHYLMGLANSGQVIEIETWFSDLDTNIEVELETKPYDLWNPLILKTHRHIDIMGLKSEWDDIEVEVIMEGQTISTATITDDYIDITRSLISLGESPLWQISIGGWQTTSTQVDLYKYMIRLPLMELSSNVSIRMTSSSSSLVWTLDRISLEVDEESEDLFYYNNIW